MGYVIKGCTKVLFPFQRPMMLDAAVGLAQTVKQQDDMSWDNVDKVQTYIAKLKQHTDNLARYYK